MFAVRGRLYGHLAAMYNTPGLAAHIGIDLLGMLTDIDPGGVYLPVKADS